jgi:hypothetical protein
MRAWAWAVLVKAVYPLTRRVLTRLEALLRHYFVTTSANIRHLIVSVSAFASASTIPLSTYYLLNIRRH